MNFLLTHVYGKDILKKQLLLSVLSFVSRKGSGVEPFKVVIYTDKPRHMKMFFGSFVKIEQMGEEFFKEHGKGEDSVKMLKMQVMRDFLNHHYGNMLYADVDTYFSESPATLFNAMSDGQFILNDAKNTQQPGSDNSKTFEGTVGGGSNTEKEHKKSDNTQFDTGVIGIPTKQASVMDDVIRYYRELPTTLTPTEREQRAFTEVLNRGNLKTADTGFVYHYKHNSEEVSQSIRHFFREHFYADLGELMQLASAWKPPKS